MGIFERVLCIQGLIKSIFTLKSGNTIGKNGYCYSILGIVITSCSISPKAFYNIGISFIVIKLG